MNLELLAAFHQNYPEAADGHLERNKRDASNKEVQCAPYAVCLQFNRHGSMIAIGCYDGKIELWDFVTRRQAKYLIAHSHPVCSLTWNRESRYLASSSTDNMLCVWNVVTGECETSFRFPCPVIHIQFQPRYNPQRKKVPETFAMSSKRRFENRHEGPVDLKILVCPMKHPAVVVRTKEPNSPPVIVNASPSNNSFDSEFTVTASYDRRGKYIYSANSKGTIVISDSETNDVVNSFKAVNSANSAIKEIQFSRRGDAFLLNCADKIIRVYDCNSALRTDPEPMQKLRDIVTQSVWKKCCFSGDGEYICAASAKQHSIYIWERSSGIPVKILNGQKGDSLNDVVWHPLRPIIVSLTNSATKEQVTIWAQTQVQNWSAFAPDFKELDENVEYEERESEFDLEDEDKSEDEHRSDVELHEEIDVEHVEPVQALLSSDEECEALDILYFLPILPEFDEISVTPQEPAVFSDNASLVNLPMAPTGDVHPLAGSKKSSGGALIPGMRSGSSQGHSSANRKAHSRNNRDRNKRK